VAGRRRPGAAEQNVGIFCVPGIVADRGPICFSSGSLLRFFPHVRDPREGVAMEERETSSARRSSGSTRDKEMKTTMTTTKSTL
jgi:hypothetical protein